MRLDLEQMAIEVLAATVNEYQDVQADELVEALNESFLETFYRTLRACGVPACALDVDEMRSCIAPKIQRAHARWQSISEAIGN